MYNFFVNKLKSCSLNRTIFTHYLPCACVCERERKVYVECVSSLSQKPFPFLHIFFFSLSLWDTHCSLHNSVDLKSKFQGLKNIFSSSYFISSGRCRNILKNFSFTTIFPKTRLVFGCDICCYNKVFLSKANNMFGIIL